jgi:GTPase
MKLAVCCSCVLVLSQCASLIHAFLNAPPLASLGCQQQPTAAIQARRGDAALHSSTALFMARRGGSDRKTEEVDTESDDIGPLSDEDDLDFNYEVDINFDDGAEEEMQKELYVGDVDEEPDFLSSYAEAVEGEPGIDPRLEQPKSYKDYGPAKPVRSMRVQGRRAIPVVAVIGRPNVGKSAIVNRIARKFADGSIVFDEEGVTRDRTYKRAFFDEFEFDIVDTGGLVFDEDPDDMFAGQIRAQALIALGESSAAIMVVDGQVGVTALDQEVARFLRQQKVPVVLAVNKCESEVVGTTQAAEFWSLGLGEPWPISGLHGYGIGNMLDLVKPHLYVADLSADVEDTINVAIVGRPNVGKSSLLNKLYGQDRAIVSEVAGTTRDTIDALFERGNRTYRLIDTAGIRRKKKIEYGNEFFMINRAFKAIRRSDVSLLVIDVVDGIKDQDRILADRIQQEGRGCVIVLNKWDAVEKDEKTYLKTIKYVREMLSPVKWADIVFTSALTGQRTPQIFDMVDEAVEQHRKRIKTSVLNEVLRDAVLWQAPPTRKNSQQGKIYYCNQVASRPPTVAIFCNNPKLFGDNYKRYLERKFREQLGFKSTPIRFLWRGKRLRRMVQDESRKARYPKPYQSG